MFGDSLRTAAEIPQYILDIQSPNGLVLAADYSYNPVHELEGQVEALNLVDLESEGLEMYIPQVRRAMARVRPDNSEQSSVYFEQRTSVRYWL